MKMKKTGKYINKCSAIEKQVHIPDELENIRKLLVFSLKDFYVNINASLIGILSL